jgi:EAL and modified HD-GYP domain-containing signal transduction protein
MMSGRRLESHQPAVVRLLAAINKPRLDTEELAQAIAMDVGLSYKLLRYINEARLFGRRHVESIPDAIAGLGAREMRRWANLIALSTVAEAPSELLCIGLVRAKMCELLALASGAGGPEQYFLVGLLSTVDQMLSTPIDEILDGLPVAERIRRALLGREGDAGHALRCAIDYERWNLDQLAYRDLSLAQIGEIYLESVAWVNSVDASLDVRATPAAQD